MNQIETMPIQVTASEFGKARDLRRTITDTNLKKCKILIVDDEEANIRILEKILRRDGYSRILSTVDSGRAHDLIDEFQPDLLCLDLMMSPLDGFAVMEQLKNTVTGDANLPILILTADTREEMRKRVLSGGAKDILIKPYDVTEALLRIQNLLEWRIAYQQIEHYSEQLEVRVRERTLQLEESTVRHRLLIEEMPVIFYETLCGPPPRTIYVSSQIETVLGFSAQEWLAQPDLWEKQLHPLDRDRVLREWQKCLGNRLLFNMEYRLTTKAGQVCWLQDRTQPSRNNKNLYRGYSTDITRRKQAEEELGRFINLSPDLICTIGFDGVFKRGNPSFGRILAFSEEEFLGKPLMDFVCPDDREATQAEVGKIMAGKASADFSNRFRTKSGSYRWLEWSAVAVPGEELIYFTARDVTTRRHTELELEAVNRQLVDASHKAGMAEVATTVLHNVGNVLNSVNVTTSLISESIRSSKISNLAKAAEMLEAHRGDLGIFLTQDPKGKQLPGYFTSLSNHLLKEREGLLKELQSLSQNVEHIKEIVSMQQNYAHTLGVVETLAVKDLVEDALHINAAALNRHDVDVVREFEEVQAVFVDRHKVLQILVNLIRNAKYAVDEVKPRDKRMTIRIKKKNDSFVSIAVMDNGIGIPPENMARIFEHGFTTRENGHGFGLHGSILAAQELGGALHAKSEGHNRGATFILELPCPAKEVMQ